MPQGAPTTRGDSTDAAPRFFVGLTGGSGHIYAERLVVELLRAGCSVDLSITEAGCKVLRHERGVDAGTRGEGLADVAPRLARRRSASTDEELGRRARRSRPAPSRRRPPRGRR